MNDQVKERLEKLAAFIEATEGAYSLSVYPPLWWRGQPGAGFSVLGLICEAHREMT